MYEIFIDLWKNSNASALLVNFLFGGQASTLYLTIGQAKDCTSWHLSA